jgi:hypothetical protein
LVLAVKRRAIALLALIAIALLVASCAEEPYQRCTPEYNFGLRAHYDVDPDRITPQNIAVDSSGQAVNYFMIDVLTDKVEECLARSFPGGVMPETVWGPGGCRRHSFRPHIRRECLTVKVAPDWWVGKSGDQLLPWGNGGECQEKGFGPGPCYFRATIQDDLTIVVTPNLKLYAGPLVQIATGCELPWSSPELSACIILPPAP